MKLNRVFTLNFKIENIKYIDIPCEIKDDQGNIIFYSKNLEVPESWSISSIEQIVRKYFIKQPIIPVALQKVSEQNIPTWLQRNVANNSILETLPEEDRYTCETSVKQLINRIALSWTYYGYKNQYFNTEDQAKIFYEEMFYILIHKIALPSATQMVNQGLYWAYGIKFDDNEYFIQKSEITPNCNNLDSKEIVFDSCILSTDDIDKHSNGVIQLINNELKLVSCSIGSCTNYSFVRSKNEVNQNGLRTKGVVHSIQLSDKLVSTIKVSSPRDNLAKLAILNDNHPDILDFVYLKVSAEKTMVSLTTGTSITDKILGYFQTTYKDLAYININNEITNDLELKKNIYLAQSLKIPAKFIRMILSISSNEQDCFDFQTYASSLRDYNPVISYHTSLSIRLSNSFLEHVQQDAIWPLKSVTNKTEIKTISSSLLMQQISYASWACSEPSIQFDTTINQWNTCKQSGYIKASSLKEDYMFLNNTASTFANINLLEFRKTDGTFNIETFSHVVNLLCTAQDILFFMALYPNEVIEKETINYRPISIGYCNFASYIMSIGIPYGSEEARSFCSAITSILTGYCYITSANIASKLGCFPKYKENEDVLLQVINNHKEAINSGSKFKDLSIYPKSFDKDLCEDTKLANKAISIWDDVTNVIIKYGLRNAQVTSLSLRSDMETLVENATSSVTPIYSIITNKKDKDDKYVKQLIPVVLLGLNKLGYNKQQIENINKYICGHKTLENCPYINRHSLSKKGFNDEILNKVEELITNISNIEFVFNHYILGADFCKNVLKLDLDQLKNPNVSLLQKIGFSEDEIVEANKYINGRNTVLGSLDLKKQHAHVFDTLLSASNNNENYISHVDQIKMIAAAQSFISGAVSNVVTLPKDSSIQDFKSAYFLAWKSGVKTIRLYREGFNLSQPLQPDIIQDPNLTKIDLLQEIKNQLVSKIITN